jgi:putative intracellular protease/amidase
MRQYLGGQVLHDKVAAFWQTGRPVGAICHGVLVLARSGVLGAAKTTCLPKYMERSAYMLTFWLRGKYYRTYPEYVEDEVKRSLADPVAQFVRGPKELTHRGSDEDDTHAFVVEDGRYISARWPGDAYLFAKRFMSLL